MVIKPCFNVKFLTSYPGYDYTLMAMGNLKIDRWLKNIRFIKNIFPFLSIFMLQTIFHTLRGCNQHNYLRKLENLVNQTLAL